jgi:hypothetical protein
MPDIRSLENWREGMEKMQADDPQTDRVEEGFAAHCAGRQYDARRLMDQAVAEARSTTDCLALARALKGSARVHRDQHRVEGAFEEYLEAEALPSACSALGPGSHAV